MMQKYKDAFTAYFNNLLRMSLSLARMCFMCENKSLVDQEEQS